MEIDLKFILLFIFLVGFPVFMILDSISIKWVKIRIYQDMISFKRLFRRKKTYNLTTDLHSWSKNQGYSRFGGNGYILAIRFKNNDSFQIDSSYNINKYEEVFRILDLKFKDKFIE